MEESVLGEWCELLKYESVGSDPSRLKECVACASWFRKWLMKLGFTVEMLYPGEGSPASEGSLPPPVLFAERKGDEGSSAVLVYGHYDVQPPDPLEEWRTPPFGPTVVDGRVYCRGANDDKGQTFALLCGLRDYLASEGRKINIKIVLDGQEESGSKSLSDLVPSLRRRLAADVLLVCDTSAAPDLRPSIIAGLRGISHFTVRLSGPNRDLHSGEYGGISPNPAQGIAELMASLHLPDGSIAVAGFRDGIENPTHDELSTAEMFGPSDETLAEDIGCDPCGGQTGKTLVQRNSFEPTIEVNGIHSGYGGPGSKTVIPAGALAKLSMRLVPDQNPDDVMAAVSRHLRQHTPRGMKLFIEGLTGEAAGFRLPLASPVFRLAASVLEEIDPRGAVYQWDGASIPVVSTLKTCSGAAPLLVGFGQPEDRIHSPNESYGLNQFARAMAWAEKILAALTD